MSDLIQKTFIVSFFMATVAIRELQCAYCDDHKFKEQKPGVQFTKELTSFEYGAISSFKTLHCCGKKYLSLEWFKDGRPYPWPGDVSSFILNPESANQTIYTRSLSPSDHGVYTCQLANHTTTINHSVELKTTDVAGYWGEPLPTYKMPVKHNAHSGDSIRLYCEGFVGKVDLPDATNTITWKKVNENRTVEPTGKYGIERIIRENEQVLGAFLYINNIQDTDYGQYLCTISNTDDQFVRQFTNITKIVVSEQSDEKLIKELVFIICIMLLFILTVWKFRWIGTMFQRLRKNIIKDKYMLSKKITYNLVIFYDEENKESAHFLKEKMEHHENYIIKSYLIDFDEEVVKTHADLAKSYDFAIYLLSSDDTQTSSLTKSSIKSFIQDNASLKNYLINYCDLPITPTKKWCDKIMSDLNDGLEKRNQNCLTNDIFSTV
ncbi:uncharacterized protein LOC126905477 [Daktulosphaira vitifoliae]|uniref:uncharacterized protein LOC126905477 n=1 Tax=Daktulosphaira vitifoliae TaxID=58002 RepID=UPI0021A9EF42|nr:uncharacterized protein LOC126905477 [Daktulosphaira vitifoliae]